MSSTDIPEPVASFLAAVNAHDEQVFLSAFTENGAVDDWGRTFTGTTRIKAWSDAEFLGSHGTLTVEEVRHEGDRIIVVGEWRSTHANGRSAFGFDVSGDKISKMTIREG